MHPTTRSSYRHLYDADGRIGRIANDHAMESEPIVGRTTQRLIRGTQLFLTYKGTKKTGLETPSPGRKPRRKNHTLSLGGR